LPNRPTVSVVICAYTEDRWLQLKQAVASAETQTSPPIEIIVCIDHNEELLRKSEEYFGQGRPAGAIPLIVLANKYNGRLGSAHNTAVEFVSGEVLTFLNDDVATSDWLEQRIARAHGTKRRFGAGQARNAAAEKAGGEILAFLDDDAVAETTWIEELLKPYTDPSVLAVGGAPHPNYETERPLWFPRQFDWVFGCTYEGLPTTTGPFPRLIGANMSARADALKQVGGFHSIDFDDMDMCHRVAALGGPASVIFTPSAVVRHYVPAQRVSWSYFWRRCFYVNRFKVEAHRGMGAASSFGPDAAFVARTLSVGVMRELRSVFRGDWHAFLRVAAILVGVTSAALGNVVGHADGTRQR
jgi:glucosyl-dolichyl phosphate glucuronosyltransferase